MQMWGRKIKSPNNVYQNFIYQLQYKETVFTEVGNSLEEHQSSSERFIMSVIYDARWVLRSTLHFWKKNFIKHFDKVFIEKGNVRD